MKLVLRVFVVLTLFAPLVTGCATYDKVKAPPVASKPIAVVYSGEGASGWSDLNIGAYRVPNSDVIISGHEETSGLGVALFGVVGVLAQDAAGSTKNKSATASAEAALHVDLASQAVNLTRKLVESDQFGQVFTMSASGAATLTVTPFTVITFVNDTDVRPYVFLKATLNSGGSGWSGRYIASSGMPVPLVGTNSLTANDGEILKATLAQNLERAVSFMLEDVANPHLRNEIDKITLDIDLPFLRAAHSPYEGYKLAEDNHFVVFAPKIADANVMAGIYIVDKSVTHPATPPKDAK